MKEGKEDVDYEEDVVKFKKVWEEMKEPNRKSRKEVEAKTQAATQTKFATDLKDKSSKEKRTKVIVSEQNLNNVTRNPKPKHDELIEVVTRPEKMYSDTLKNERNNVAP